MKWSKEECEILIQNYPLLGGDCDKLLNRNKKQIGKKAYRMGLKVSKERKLYIDSKKGSFPRNINYKLSEKHFDLNNKDVVYVLGLLWADGYFNENINKIDISIQKDDGDEFIKSFNKIGKWSYYERHRENRKPQIGFCASNKSIGEFFKRYNYHNKSYDEPIILDSLNDKMKRYWWLGFFDGDGCCYYNKNCKQISMSGTYDYTWTYFSDLAKNLDINYTLSRKIYKNGKCSIVRFTNRKSIINFYNYIYQDDEFGLSRKRTKYTNMINSYKR